MAGCGLCDWQVVASSVSPDGRHTAEAIHSACGATTGVFTTIVLHSRGRIWNDTHRLFGGLEIPLSVSFRWLDNAHLVVYCNRECDAGYIERRSVDGVDVQFVALSSAP
jgi:hypothetical protein